MAAPLLTALSAYAFAATPHAAIAARGVTPHAATDTVRMSAKLIPVGYVGIGATLLTKAAKASGAEAVVLASTGMLAIFDLATVDNARYATGKRAVKVYEGKTSLTALAEQQMGVAKLWYTLVRCQLLGSIAGLVVMTRGATMAGAATFMAANVGFFLGGAGRAKHDAAGLPTPIKPKLLRFLLVVDSILLAGALLGVFAAGTTAATAGAYLFATGCLIGVAEGIPKTVAACKALLA